MYPRCVLYIFFLLTAQVSRTQDSSGSVKPLFPGFDTTALDAYANDPAYQYRQRTPDESLLDQWWRSFKNLLRRMFFEGRNTWQGILYLVLLASGMILLIYFFGRSRLQGIFSRRDVTTGSASILETELPGTPLDVLADQASGSGDYRLAYRWAYLYLLSRLGKQGRLHIHRDKTNRDYRRDMRTDSDRNNFILLADTFDQVWYGGYPMTAETYATRRNAIDHVLKPKTTTS